MHKIQEKLPFILAESLLGFAAIATLKTLFSLNFDFADFLTPISVAVILNILIQKKPIITTFVLIGSILFFTFAFFNNFIQMLSILRVTASFLAVCWAILWRHRKFGVSMIVLSAVILCAVPGFFGIDNTISIVTSTVSVILLGLLNIPVKKKTEKNALSGHSFLPVIAVLIALCIPSAMLTGAMKEYPRNANLIQALQNADIFTQISDGASDFDLSDMGFGGSVILGGPSNLDASPIFTVKTNMRMNLRCTVYDRYTGTSWRRLTHLYNYPYSKLLYASDFKEIFSTNLPKENVPEGFYQNASFEISQINKPMKSLPVPFRFNSIDTQENEGLIMYNNLGEVFSSKFLRSRYSISGKIPDTNGSVFQDWMQKNADKFTENESHMAQIMDLYCQLPEDLPSSVASTAREIMKDGNSYQKAKRLEAWLSSTKKYTLTPNNDYSFSDDFVQNFLLSNEGYCVHFATAMTVMLRTQGIPARYVTGFAIPVAGTNDTYIVKRNCAHAWCEVYFEGIGWIPFEPTASGSAANTILGEDNQPDSSYVPPQITPDQFPEVPDATDSPGIIDKTKKINHFDFFPAFILILLYIIIIFIRKRSAHSSFGPEISCWHKLENMLRAGGIRRPPNEPLSLFAARAALNPRFTGCKVELAAQKAESILYGNNEPFSEPIDNACKLVWSKLLRHEKIKTFLYKIFS